MMKRKQREMPGNGGSPGCPSLVVSRSLVQHIKKRTCTTHADAHVFCFMKWRTTVVITSLRVTMRRKKRRLQKRKKKTSPQRRSLLSR